MDSEPLVFLNGELVKGNGTYSDWGTGGEYSMLPSIKLHSGDALTLVVPHGVGDCALETVPFEDFLNKLRKFRGK